MKQINITLDTAIRLYEQGGDGRALALTVYTEHELTSKELVNSWNDLDSISGYWIEANSTITHSINLNTYERNKNIFATEKQAKSALAMAQLSQLMADCGDCDIDFNNNDQAIYCIYRMGSDVSVYDWDGEYRFLTFKTLEIAEKFLELHKELIKQYFMM